MKTNTRKIFAWVMTFAMLLSLCPMMSIPAGAAKSGDYTYTVTDGKATITKYSGSGGEITIPSELDGYPVTAIGDKAFFDCRGLTSVTIGDSVTTIGDKAFFDCRGLTSVTIGDSVTTIGDEAFSGCRGLTSVTIGDSVTTIGDYAFSDCRGLTSVTIPNSVMTIEEYAFYGCSSLTSVTIGDSVTTIGGCAFSECSSLTSVTIGDSVTTIGDEAFSFCDSLTSVTIGDSVTTIGSSAFSFCGSLTSVTIGDSVTTIGQEAFYECSSLTSVTIPGSVTTIENSAFSDCSGLTSVTIGDSVTTIGQEAFYECSSLTSVTIGNSVTTIEEYAFLGCSNLTSVTIPASVKVIGSMAFNYISFANVTFEGDVMPGMCSDSFENISISEKDDLDSNVTVDIVGFKNGENIENEIWMGELLRPVVTGYTGSDELYYRFETDNSRVNSNLSFYTSDMKKECDGASYLYLPGEAYAAIRSNYTPSQITCSVYTMKKEDSGFAATKIASKTVNLTTDNFISDAATANEKEFEQNNVVLMQQGDSATLAELLGKAGFTHVTCYNAHMADITTSEYGKNDLTVNKISGGDRNTVITASETKTGLSKLTFDFWSTGCTYHGTTYSEEDPLSVTMYIYVVAKPAFQTTANTIKVIDNTGDYATSTYQIGLGEPATTFTGLNENTEYDVLQTLTVKVDDEDYTGVYHNYVKTKSVIDLTVTDTKVADKEYDGTTEAAVTLGTVDGIKQGDDVTVTATAVFPDANAGNKNVEVTYTLSGKDADKYTAPISETISATINKADNVITLDKPETQFIHSTDKFVTPNVTSVKFGDQDKVKKTELTRIDETNEYKMTWTLAEADNWKAAETSVIAVVDDNYDLKIMASGGGTVTAEQSKYKSEETVTLTVTTNTGYTLTELTYGDTDITSQVSSEGKVSFEMPASDTTVIAVFEVAETKYTVTVNAGEGGTVTVKDLLYGEQKENKFKQGDLVRIVVTPADAKHVLESLTVKQGNEDVAMADATSFYMPAGNVTVTATFGTKIFHPAVEGNCGYDGNIAYWESNGKYYSEDCTNEISLADTVVKATGNHTNDKFMSWTWINLGDGKGWTAYYTTVCSVCGKNILENHNATLTTDDSVSGQVTYYATITVDGRTYSTTKTVDASYTVTHTKIETEEAKAYDGFSYGAVCSLVGGSELYDWCVNGTKVKSASKEYSFCVTANTAVTSETTEDTQQQPVLAFTTSGRTDKDAAEKTKVGYTVTWSLPEGCTLVSAGLKRAYNVGETPAISQLTTTNKSALTNRNGSYSLTVSMSAATSKKSITAVGYLTYKDASGTITTMYSTPVYVAGAK